MKILVKAPVGAEEIVSTFPFFHQLKDEYIGAQINVLVEEGQEYLYRFLPFHVNVFPIPLEKKSLPGLHHFAVNLHDVFNIDLFFDLEGSFKSAFLGQNFKPREKVGFLKGINKLLIRQGIKTEGSARFDRNYLKLLEYKTQKDFKMLQVLGHERPDYEVENFFKAEEPAPYLFFMIGKIKEGFEELEFWQKLISTLDSQKIVFWNYNQKMEFQTLLEDLPETNQYVIFEETNPDYLASLMIKSKGVLTTDTWAGYLSSYLGVNSYLFAPTVREVPYFSHFKVSPTVVEYDHLTPKRILSSDSSEIITSIEEFIDFACDDLCL